MRQGQDRTFVIGHLNDSKHLWAPIPKAWPSQASVALLNSQDFPTLSIFSMC